MLKIFAKKMVVIANVFPKLRLSKNWLKNPIETTVSEPPSTVNILMGPKTL